jgi:H/ACA ribonucleoprotein complex subunit 3
MKWKIRRCPICKRYTLKEICIHCKVKTIVPHPHRFSPEDKYVIYRILSKYPELTSKINKISSKED